MSRHDTNFDDNVAHAATHRKPSFLSLVRALCGREKETERTYMTIRERIDFLIITLLFGVFVGV